MKQEKGKQYIMQHDKIIFASPDKVSIQTLWNNITGKNFVGKDITGARLEGQYAGYLEMMKITAGLPSGYIQLYLKPGVLKEEFCVPASTNVETAKKEIINQGRSIKFGSATKYSDIFTDTNMKELTEKALGIAQGWSSSSYYFEAQPREENTTLIYICANHIIASTIFAIIETKSIPKKKEEITSEVKPIEIKSTKTLTAKEVLNLCKITYDHIVKLPDMKLDRKVYEDVKSIIQNNGGRWKGGKIQGFQFNFDPTELFHKLHSREDVNNKKDFQFFATPDEIVNLMITKASIKKTDMVLEPSAGQGAIADKIKGLCRILHLCELMPENRQILEKKGYEIMWGDFLAINEEINENIKYDKIIANPPFTKNQDIDHVMKMYAMLKKGGRIVVIMSPTWVTGTQKKQVGFRSWLTEVGGTWEAIEEGAFKKSGTGIKTYMVVIDKL